MTIHVEPTVSPIEVAPAPAERMHPISRRLVAGILAGGIGVAGLIAANQEPLQRFIENPMDALFDPLFDNESAGPIAE